MRPTGTQLVPAEPFAQWLNMRLAYWRDRIGDERGAVTALCNEVGWVGETGTRRAYRMRNQLAESAIGRKKGKGAPGQRTVTHADSFARRVVEEALHRAGVRLGEVYPFEALVDEFAMEYLVPRDQATRLADAWIESTWQSVWEKVGLFVNEEDRPSCYCRACKRTTRLFMGTCDSCGVAHPPALVAAVAVAPVSSGVAPSEAVAQAHMLRQRYRMPYRQIAVVMAVYHGVSRDERSWRTLLGRLSGVGEPRGVPFKAEGKAA